MKHLKMLGLVALTATALTAFADSAASADVLCKAVPNGSGECSTTVGDYASGTTFTAESTNPTFTVKESGFFAQIACENSNVAVKTTTTGSNTSGAAVTAEVTQLSFTGNCKTDNGLSCTLTETKGYGTTFTATNDKGNGAVVMSGPVKMRIVCGGFFACEFEPTGSNIQFTFTGGNPFKEVATEQPWASVPGGIGCGLSLNLDATYFAIGATKSVAVATKNA